jgi:hypothetical protein
MQLKRNDGLRGRVVSTDEHCGITTSKLQTIRALAAALKA